jgi:hypothetical protein
MIRADGMEVIMRFLRLEIGKFFSGGCSKIPFFGDSLAIIQRVK